MKDDKYLVDKNSLLKFESIEKHIEISRVVLLHRIEREEGRGATFKPNEDEDVNGRTDSSRD